MPQPIYSKNEANNELARLQLQLNMLSRLQAAGPTSRGNINQSSARMFDINKAVYEQYKGPLSKALQKTMWPSIILSSMVDWNKQIAGGIGRITGRDVSSQLESVMGPLGALGYMVPSIMSRLLKTKRMAYEKDMMPKLGAVGQASRALDLFYMTRHLTRTLPAGMAMLAGRPDIAKKIPRPEAFLTGPATGAYSVVKKAGGAVGGAVDSISGGLISKGLKTVGETSVGKHVGGALAKVFGGIDTGIMSVLGSPMGLSLALAGAQIGLSILKSIRMARLFPTKRSTAKLSREYSITMNNAQIGSQIDALAQTGKVKQEQLSYMILKLIEFNTRATEQQVAGLRAEYVSEMDLIRQEREKGTERFGESYESDILGKSKKSFFGDVMDKVEGKIQTVMEKYNPFQQMGNFVVGLLKGKIVLPRAEQSRIAKTYGFESEKEMLKSQSAEFGISVPQARLLTIDSSQIRRMAPENQEIALLSAQFDLQRLLATEVMTIRIGMGFDKNILYRGPEKEGIISSLAQLVKKLDPRNLPGVNALYNLIAAPFKFIFKTGPGIAKKAHEKYVNLIKSMRDWVLGEEYVALRDKDTLLKKAGMYMSLEERAQTFVAKGLPQHLELIRGTLLEQTEIQSNIFNVLQRQLELSGEQYDYITMSEKTKRPLIWDVLEAQYITGEDAEMMKHLRQLQLMAVKEKGFREGMFGSLLQLLDIIVSGPKKADTLKRAFERMTKAEKFIAGREIIEFGAPETLTSEGIAKQIISEELVGARPKKILPKISGKEIEYERSLETLPETFGWKLKRVMAGLVPVLGPMVYTELYRRAVSKIAEKREKELEEFGATGRTLEQTMIAEAEKFWGKTQEELAKMGLPEQIIFQKAKLGQKQTLPGAISDLANKFDNIIDILKREILQVSVVNFADLKSMIPDWSILQTGVELVRKFDSVVDTLKREILQVSVVNFADLKSMIPDWSVMQTGADLASEFDSITNTLKKQTLQVSVVNFADLKSMISDWSVMQTGLKLTSEGYVPISIKQEASRDVESMTPYLDVNIAMIGGEYVRGSGVMPVTLAETSYPLFQWKDIAERILDLDMLLRGGKRMDVKISEIDPSLSTSKNSLPVSLEDFRLLFKSDTHIPVRAKGGLAESGKPVLVGEKGPELFVPAAAKGLGTTGGGAILPNDITSKFDQMIMYLGGIFTNTSKQTVIEEESLNSFSEIQQALIDQADEQRNRTLTQELQEVKVEAEKKEAKETQRGILDTLKTIAKNTKDKIIGTFNKKEGGLLDFLGGLGGIGKLLAGLILGGGITALIKNIKDTFFGKDDTTFMEKIMTFLFGDEEGGLISAFKVGGTLALAGASLGFAVGGPIGSIAGGLVGGAVGSIIGYIGLNKVGEAFTKTFVDNSINTPVLDLINKLHGQDSVAASFARLFAPLSIPGILAGWMIGGAVDVGLNILRMFPMGDKAANFIKSKLQPGNVLIDETSKIAAGPNVVQEAQLREVQRYNKFAAQVGAQTKTFKPATGMIEFSREGDSSKNVEAERLAQIEREAKAIPAPPVLPTQVYNQQLGESSSESQGVKQVNPAKQIPIPTSLPTNVVDAIKEGAEIAKVPEAAMLKIAAKESSLNPNAVSPTGAKGLFQFISDTWRTYISKFGKMFGFDKDTSPFNPRANAIMAGLFLKDNEKQIRRLTPNDPPSVVDLYIAHNLGPAKGGATSFFKALKENPNMLVTETDISVKSMKSNPTFFYHDPETKKHPKTVAEAYWAYSKFMGYPLSVNDIKALVTKAQPQRGVSDVGRTSATTQTGSVTSMGTSAELNNLRATIKQDSDKAKPQPKNILELVLSGFEGLTDIINENLNNVFNVATSGLELGTQLPKTSAVKTELANQPAKDEEKVVSKQEAEKAEKAAVTLPPTQSVGGDVNIISGHTIDKSLDELIEKLFASASSLFSSEFKEYPYDSGIYHSFS